MSAAYGVHFGCSSACLAVNKDDKTDVIANDLGDRTTPCIVAFTDHDQAVGVAAKQGMIRNLQNTVCHVKQILGRKYDDPVVTDYKRKSAAQVFDQSGEPRYEVDYKESRRVFSPSEIAVSIYKKMLETAQSHGGSGSQDSVLAVPTHFSSEQRRAISSAANQAGFNILRMISEPSAALMAYDIGQNDVTFSGSVLVFRLGGVSAEVSVVNIHNGMYQILTSVTDSTLGGDLFTDELMKYLVTEFRRQTRNDISDNKRAMAKLRRQAEICKHTMSKLDNVHCAVDSLYDGMDFDTKISRARFESCVSELVQRCTQLIDQVLTAANLTQKSVNKVLLCGGGTNVPVLQRAIIDKFSHCDILNSISPEEVIAIGAAKQAGILSALEDEDIKLNTEDTAVDCIAKPICIKMDEPLVENEGPPSVNGGPLPAGASLSPRNLEQVKLSNGEFRVEDTYIVSTVQPGIYSGFTPDYGSTSVDGRPRGGLWTKKQVFGVDENKERGNWTGRFEYILAMLGYAVGLGNIWRFPYLCYRHGGGAFLVPYLLFMTFVGIPLFYLESCLGQFTSCGPTTCWDFAPIFQGVGLAMMISSFIISGYYCMIIAWCNFYFFASFTSHLPWSKCEEWWNTNDCSERLPDVSCNGTGYERRHDGMCYREGNFTGLWDYEVFKNMTSRQRIAPTKEYWENYVLRVGDGIGTTGDPQWRLVLCLLFTWVLVFLCLIKGIKSAGKVVYFTAIFPYVVLVILFFRGVTLPNASEGIKYYITPDFTKLVDVSIWKAAAVQIFYSMGPAGGGIIALSSYNRFHNNILRDSMIVSLGNCMTSIFGGFVIFSFIGYMADQLKVTVDHVADDGPGLAFVIYPEAVRSLPIPAFWSVIFFFMLITLGLDSLFASVEAILTGIQDIVPKCREKKVLSIFVICVMFFLLGLPYTTRSGIFWVTLVDYYAAAWSLLLIGLLEVLAISYIYGINRFCGDIETMIGPWTTWYWKICWLAITPLSIVFILIYAWVKYQPVKYNDYHYPKWSEDLGWLISFSSIVAVPGVIVYKLIADRKGLTFLQKMKLLLLPTRDWGPALVQHRQLIKHVPGFTVNPKDTSHTAEFAYHNISEPDHCRVTGNTVS